MRIEESSKKWREDRTWIKNNNKSTNQSINQWNWNMLWCFVYFSTWPSQCVLNDEKGSEFCFLDFSIHKSSVLFNSWISNIQLKQTIMKTIHNIIRQATFHGFYLFISSSMAFSLSSPPNAEPSLWDAILKNQSINQWIKWPVTFEMFRCVVWYMLTQPFSVWELFIRDLQTKTWLLNWSH